MKKVSTAPATTKSAKVATAAVPKKPTSKQPLAPPVAPPAKPELPGVGSPPYHFVHIGKVRRNEN